MSRHITGSGKFVDVVSGKANSNNSNVGLAPGFKLSKIEQKPLTGWPLPNLGGEIIPEPIPNATITDPKIEDFINPDIPKDIPIINPYIPEERIPNKEAAPEDKEVEIPEVPANPDSKPKLIRYAEEYLGRYWFVVLAVIIYLFYRKK